MLSRLLNHDLWGNGEFRALLAGNAVERFAASALTVMLAFHVYSVRKDPLTSPSSDSCRQCRR